MHDATANDLAEQLARAPVVAEPSARPDPGQSAMPEGAPGRGDAATARPGVGKSKDRPAPPPKGPGPDRPRGQIWDGCPVKALGVNGDLSYYLDRHGQLRAVKKHEAQTILHLFGDRIEMLCRKFPTYLKGSTEPQKHRFDATRASMQMMMAASEKGLFNPDGAVRGVGAWRDDNGGLVYHCGQHLITADGRAEPDEIDGKIYPAYPPIPAPAEVAGRTDPAMAVLDTIESWTWEFQDTTPMIALGMIGVQMLCGALDWRPVYWLTGDKAYGKSAFQDMLKLLHGDKGLIQSNDPTKSGITSRLGHSSLPVAIDELEPGDERSTKERDIITLARVAASGGQWLRGSADQKGASGNVYSAFLFSSILIPGAMGPQDRSRLITLHLRPLREDAPRLSLDPRTWRQRGAVLKRLLIDRWPGWAERLALWRVALAEAGLGGRNGDNYATTMAMADMALHEALPAADYLSGWARKVARAARSETDEIGSDAEDMLMHLMGQPLDIYRRGRLYTVAQYVMAAAMLPAAPLELLSGTDGMLVMDDDERRKAAKRVNDLLATVGLRVRGEGTGAALFIANSPIPGLLKLFQGSRWASGVWKQSTARVIGAEPTRNALTLAGQSSRGVYVPLSNIAGLLSFPMGRAQTHAQPQVPPMPADWENFR